MTKSDPDESPVPSETAPGPPFLALGATDGVLVDLRYASTNNFLGRNIYGAFRTLYLHEHAAGKLRRAAALLAARAPGRSLLVLDGLRPNAAQEMFWASVPQAQRLYVADPKIGSIHNYGFAVDLTLADAAGREVDMGTGFDDFTPLSEPRLEERFLAEGRLSDDQVTNRRLLRGVMEEAGFRHLPLEWWHFDAEPPDLVRRLFPRLP